MGFRNPITTAIDPVARQAASDAQADADAALVQIIPGSRLAADAINGRTITGTVLQTAASGPRAVVDTQGGREGGGRFSAYPGGTGGPGTFEAGTDTTSAYSVVSSASDAGGTHSDVILRPDAVEVWPGNGGGMTLKGRPIRPSWTTDLWSDFGYDASVTSTDFVTLPNSGPISAGVIAVGEAVEIEWSSPLVDLPASTGLQARILANGAVLDGLYWSNSGTAAIAGPGRLRGVYGGTGAEVIFHIQALKAGPGTPRIRAIGVGPVLIRHRIT